MIRHIYSDLPSFKELAFREGLNILLSEKSPQAGPRQTRNRAGKSSMVEIVHFLLGSSAGTDSIFRSAALKPYTFALEFDLDGQPATVARSGTSPSTVIVEGSSHWSVPLLAAWGQTSIKNTGWKVVLGHLLFGLPFLDDEAERGRPSFRSLISYFARRDRDGGFLSAVQHFKGQPPGDYQVNLSYLLGLDWTIPQDLQRIREREKTLGELRRSLKEGTFGVVIDKASSLKTQLVLAQDSVTRLRQRLATFKVVDEYHHLEKEASDLTRRPSNPDRGRKSCNSRTVADVLAADHCRTWLDFAGRTVCLRD